MGFRLEKVASTVRAVIADALQHKLSDPRISTFSSVTRVEVTGDLMYAKVYVSVMGDEADVRNTMRGLKHATGYVQTLLAKRLNIRQCPHIVFVQDESVKVASKTIQAVDQVIAELNPADSGQACLDDSSTGQVGPGGNE